MNIDDVPIVPISPVVYYTFKWNPSVIYHCGDWRWQREYHRQMLRILKACAKGLGFTYIGEKWVIENRTNRKEK